MAYLEREGSHVWQSPCVLGQASCVCGNGLICPNGYVLWRRYTLILHVVVVGHIWLVTCDGVSFCMEWFSFTV